MNLNSKINGMYFLLITRNSDSDYISGKSLKKVRSYFYFENLIIFYLLYGKFHIYLTTFFSYF